MTKIQQTVLKLLVTRWNHVMGFCRRLGMAEPRPDDGYRIFAPQAADGDEICVNVGPTVFNVPERANRSATLYVHVRAFLRLYVGKAMHQQLVTKSFGTEVAYFRLNNNVLQHVYGAHYDFDLNKRGHPLFHGQLKDYGARDEDVLTSYELACDRENYFSNVLERVRIPIAQMDFFAFVLQLCADHFIDENSGEDQLKAFDDLKESSAQILGAGFQAGYFDKVRACGRANHWYPSSPA